MSLFNASHSPCSLMQTLHLSNEYLLSTYYVPNTTQGNRGIEVNKTSLVPALIGLRVQEEKQN